MRLQITALKEGSICIEMKMDTFDHWALLDDTRRRDEWPRLKNIPVNPNDFPRMQFENRKEFLETRCTLKTVATQE